MLSRKTTNPLKAGFWMFVAVAVTWTAAIASDKPKQRLRNFSALEVENFENPKMETKEPMPDAWIPTIREEIIQRVIDRHRFRRVADFNDPEAAPNDSQRTLVLRGRIIEYTQGSVAKRFLIGMGAGKGKIVAQLQFVDKAGSEIVWERKVDGRVIGAMQSTEGAIKGLGKEVAKVIDEQW
jgi:hypothetical protein